MSAHEAGRLEGGMVCGKPVRPGVRLELLLADGSWLHGLYDVDIDGDPLLMVEVPTMGDGNVPGPSAPVVVELCPRAVLRWPPSNANVRSGWRIDGMTTKAVLLAAAVLAGGCAHESATRPTVAPPAPPVAVPTPLPELPLLYLRAIMDPAPLPGEEPAPAAVCVPYEYHFLGWRMTVDRAQGRTAVHAEPTFGRRGTAGETIPAACRGLWVGEEGPTWHNDIPGYGPVPGAPDPADPYTFLVTPGATGRLWVCTRTGGECNDVGV
jgi:hypothetical protein